MKNLVAACVLIASAVACSSFGGPDTTDGPDGPDAAASVDSSTDDAASSLTDSTTGDVTVAPDAAPCDISSPAGTVVRFSFDSDNCEAWIPENATVSVSKAQSRCGAGSCKLCSTSENRFFATRSFTLAAPTSGGTHQLDFHVRNASMTSGYTAFIERYVGSSLQASQSNSGALDVSAWAAGQVVLPNGDGTTSLALTLSAQPAASGECFYLDEVILSYF